MHPLHFDQFTYLITSMKKRYRQLISSSESFTNFEIKSWIEFVWYLFLCTVNVNNYLHSIWWLNWWKHVLSRSIYTYLVCDINSPIHQSKMFIEMFIYFLFFLDWNHSSFSKSWGAFKMDFIKFLRMVVKPNLVWWK